VPLIVKIRHNKSKAAAGEVISALHDAKQEVAQELEANLKQLRSVLEDTQRIAKEMEAVLREAKNEASDQQKAQGNSEESSQAPTDKKQSNRLKASSKQGDREQKDQQDRKSQKSDQQSKTKSADKERNKHTREVQVKVVTGRTYVAARPKAWVPPPYRIAPGTERERTDWEPPPDSEENYL